MDNRSKAKQLMLEINAGCSAFSWETNDGKHLWGRNFDFNRIASESKVTYLPRNMEFYTCGTALENNLVKSTRRFTNYAVVGIGSMILESTPTLFEGMNEKGLMGGQLYYRKFSCFSEKTKEDTIPLQPVFAVTYFLTQCASVEEVVEHLERKITLINQPILGSVPTVHWMFTDCSGEAVIIESDFDQVHVYRKSMGVLTNSPGYPWHCENLLNYSQVRKRDLDNRTINGMQLEQCFSGTGALGIPGDCSSPSRFIRLAYLKEFGQKGRNEEEGVSHMFRIFQNVAFPLGMVEVGESETITKYDTNVCPYDYTIYTAIMCAESMRFYWNVYDNLQIQCVDLSKIMNKKEPIQFHLYSGENIRYLN